jgi:hypothetical protein
MVLWWGRDSAKEGGVSGENFFEAGATPRSAAGGRFVLLKNSIGVLIHGISELLEGIKHVENWLVVIDLKIGITDLIEIERASVDVRALQGVNALSWRGDKAGSVELQFAVLANETEFDGEPEKA